MLMNTLQRCMSPRRVTVTDWRYYHDDCRYVDQPLHIFGCFGSLDEQPKIQSRLNDRHSLFVVYNNKIHTDYYL